MINRPKLKEMPIKDARRMAEYYGAEGVIVIMFEKVPDSSADSDVEMAYTHTSYGKTRGKCETVKRLKLAMLRSAGIED